MRASTWFTVPLVFLVAIPCLAQRQLAVPTNPELGGFPPGHPGIPGLVDASTGTSSTWTADQLELGDSILLELLDRPATSYFELVGYKAPTQHAKEYCLPLESRIVAVNGNTIVAEYQVTLSRDSDAPRIVTVTTSLQRSLVRAPSHAYDVGLLHTDASARELTMRHAALPRIRLDSPVAVKIRMWKPVEEVKSSSQ